MMQILVYENSFSSPGINPLGELCFTIWILYLIINHLEDDHHYNMRPGPINTVNLRFRTLILDNKSPVNHSFNLPEFHQIYWTKPLNVEDAVDCG